MAWSVYAPAQAWLDTAAHTSVFGLKLGQAIPIVLGVITAIILPGLLSGFAKRWTFFWGLLPISLCVFIRDGEDWIESGFHEDVNNLWFSLILIGLCLLISSGPVSLYRWLRGRGKRHREAQARWIAAQQEAAAIPRDGVWPPPPDCKG